MYTHLFGKKKCPKQKKLLSKKFQLRLLNPNQKRMFLKGKLMYMTLELWRWFILLERLKFDFYKLFDLYTDNRQFNEKIVKTLAHSLIRGVLIQSCPAGAKNFTNYVFCHLQFSGDWCYPKYWKSLCHFDSCLSMYNQFYRVKNRISKILLL